jgi:hypothetical protein
MCCESVTLVWRTSIVFSREEIFRIDKIWLLEKFQWFLLFLSERYGCYISVIRMSMWYISVIRMSMWYISVIRMSMWYSSVIRMSMWYISVIRMSMWYISVIRMSIHMKCQLILRDFRLTPIFSGGKGGRCVWLTTLPPSCADCLEIWEPRPPGALRACPGL